MIRIKEALATTGLAFTAYAWQDAPAGDWGVYGIQYGDSLDVDNAAPEEAVVVAVDYFTHSDGEDARRIIRNALNDAGLPNKLNSVQYEQDTRLLHLEWLVTLYA